MNQLYMIEEICYLEKLDLASVPINVSEKASPLFIAMVISITLYIHCSFINIDNFFSFRKDMLNFYPWSIGVVLSINASVLLV